MSVLFERDLKKLRRNCSFVCGLASYLAAMLVLTPAFTSLLNLPPVVAVCILVLAGIYAVALWFRPNKTKMGAGVAAAYSLSFSLMPPSWCGGGAW
jgi:hypothetical protein